MQYAEIIEGLQILAKYTPNGLAEHVSAEHEELFAHRNEVTDAADRARLDELGWTFSESYGCWHAFC